MQVVVEPEDKELFKKSESIRMSYVLQVTGILRKRPKGTINESDVTKAITVNKLKEGGQSIKT